jgi:type II secretory pathway component GspD/PulD (secretin)
MLIRALETQDKIRVLSRPQLVTLHNLRAQIHVGQDVPFVSGTSATNGTTQSQTEWRQVGTILDITPRIMPDGMVSMAVLIERSSMGSEADGVPLYESGGTLIKQPKVNSTNAQTTINAHDGQTVVFAGLISEQKETVNRSVPVLNKIPLVRHAFEYDSTVNQRSELLIILTPTIIRKREDLELLKQQETARMHWCINDVVKLTGNSNMRLRSDEWLPSEMNYRNAPPMILNESQLPPENKIPVPLLAPAVEK